MPVSKKKKSSKKSVIDPVARRLRFAAWVIGLGSSFVMGYFEYFAITQDLDMSHTSLVGYPGYCLALVITTVLAILYVRRVYKKNWNFAVVALALWTAVAIASTLLVTNSTSN